MAMLLILSVCTSSAAEKQFKIRILDAETGRAIPEASVSLHYYPSTPDLPSPDHPRAIADTLGEVLLPDKKDEEAIWQVQAEGYIEQRFASKAGEVAPRFAAHAKDNLDGMIYLYKTPEPQLDIQVSDTYSGPLTIQLEPGDGFGWIKVDEMNTAFAALDPQASYIQNPAGRRVFTETAAADGMVYLRVKPLLYDLKQQQIHVLDSSGLLPASDLADPQDFGRSVWGAVTEDEKLIDHQIQLFIGTKDAYLEYLLEQQSDQP
jgi:hypothetical protein